jgi:hypothetical protein
MRPLDPLLIILGCYAILSLRERVRESVRIATGSEALQEA